MPSLVWSDIDIHYNEGNK